MAVADKNTENVTLAGQEYVMKRIPMARMRQIGPKLAAIISEIAVDFDPKDAQSVGGVAGVLMDKLLEIPYEVLSLFIPTVPKEIFQDEDNGVTFPEFEEAFRTAMELNRLDMLKGFFTKLTPGLLQTMKR